MAPQTTEKIKKVVKIVVNVILYVFLALCIAALLITAFSKRDKTGCVTIFGMQMRVVETPSMAANPQTDVSQYKIKSIPVNSMVFIRTVPEEEPARSEFFDELEVGDVLTFRYTYATQETITHRLIEKVPIEGGYLLYLRGDNPNGTEDSASSGDTQVINTTESVETATNYVIGKVTGKNLILGTIVAIVKKPVGLALFIIVPCAIIAVIEIVRIANVLSARKREKVAAENAMMADRAMHQEEELEMLRQRLSQLERQNTGGGGSSDEVSQTDAQTEQPPADSTLAQPEQAQDTPANDVTEPTDIAIKSDNADDGKAE